MTTRREFITLLGATAVSWPVTAGAQQRPMPVVGYLSNLTPDGDKDFARAVRQGLAETGYVEGRNVAMEFRPANEENARLPVLAADLVRRQVAVIIGAGVSASLAAKAATTTIPIVFNMGVDPVERGFVASLNRPGRNLTGVSNLNVRLEPKRLELLHEVIPKASRIALLVNPTNPLAATISKDVEAAASTLRLELEIVQASTAGRYRRDLCSLGAKGCGRAGDRQRWTVHQPPRTAWRAEPAVRSADDLSLS